MPKSLQTVLQQSVEDVLEKMFFIRSLEDASELPPDAGSELAAHMTFHGEPSGSLLLRVSRPAAQSISADFLGADESEITPEQVGEVVCELANMICGSVLSRVESSVTFRLGAPELREALPESAEPDGDAGETAVHCVETAGGNLTVVVKTESPVCSMTEKRVS